MTFKTTHSLHHGAGDPMTFPNHHRDMPHRAAVNDGPWQSFPSYKAARAYVARKVRRPSDAGWVWGVTPEGERTACDCGEQVTR